MNIMGFRWRKSFNIIPGVRINVSKRNVSTTIGGKYARVNLSKKGTSIGASLPNTGISYNKILNRTFVGASTQNIDKGVNMRSSEQIIAALLAFFLGTFGIHKFYTGRVFWGFVYLLFCWSGIPTILGFVEGLIYLIRSPESFYERYRM